MAPAATPPAARRRSLPVLGLVVLAAVALAVVVASSLPSARRSPRAAHGRRGPGVVTGILEFQAGLDPSWVPMHGVVTFHPVRAEGGDVRAWVPRSGRFAVPLPAGTWSVTGASPMFTVNGRPATCTAAAPVPVRRGSRASVAVRCIGR